MSWIDLEFEPVSASFDITHDPAMAGPSVHIRLHYVGESPLLDQEGEVLEYNYWSLMIQEADSTNNDDEIEYVGKAKRISRNLISVSVDIPTTHFRFLVDSLLSNKSMSDVTMQAIGLEETEHGFMWSDPDNEPLVIESVSVRFNVFAKALATGNISS